ncbi:MAG TPA: DUF1015 domain-containing protein, partial [Chloroflexota bacterium]|nr:DUF1015 domain-containing protein [Chloroflexota bacterium]
MPDVRPFRAWRYDTALAGALAALICPPYDVITPAAAERLHAENPRNVIHLELGPGPADPTAPDNRYVRAAATLERWIADGILRRDATSCFYVYEQTFLHGGRTHRRLAFFAAVSLSPWEARAVLPHEVTLATPKADRTALLKATRANISPIYALCDGGLPSVAALLSVAAERPPDDEATEQAGECHRLWAVSDPGLLSAVTRDLAARPLCIADGHHRYETALAYARKQGDARDPEGAGYVLMAITPVDDPCLLVLPTHRLLRDLESGRLEDALAHLDDVFAVRVVDDVPPAASLLAAMAEAAQDYPFGLYTPGLARLLRARPSSGAGMQSVEPALRTLDVALLQQLFFEELLGLTPDDLRRQRNVDYTRDAD